MKPTEWLNLAPKWKPYEPPPITDAQRIASLRTDVDTLLHRVARLEAACWRVIEALDPNGEQDD